LLAYRTILKNGIIKGLETVWELTKVMAPFYIAVTLLAQTPVMGFLDKMAKPVMKLVGLPGEAATAIVVGNVLNIYAAIGTMSALSLNAKEVTIIALMILISHNLFIETAVSKKTGINVTSLVLVRIIGSFIAGILLNWGWM